MGNFTCLNDYCKLTPRPPKAARAVETRVSGSSKDKRRGEAIAEPAAEAPAQTPQEALARIEIPQDVSDQISALIVPGSSLVVSDMGLGEETGEGTDFIVLTPPVAPVASGSRAREKAREKARAERRAEHADRHAARAHHPHRLGASAPEL